MSKVWKIILYIMLFLFVVMIGAGAGLIAAVLRTAPSLDQVNFNPEMSTILYDIKGREITKLHDGENRIPVSLSEIPQHMQLAILAIEDHLFYEHIGISFRGIIRALIRNVLRGTITGGGGTITGQLARNAFLTLDQTISRKIQEVIWAIQIERKYTKDEILEAYLNIIYFGHKTYGVQAAAQTFFGKDIGEVDLAEAALLAAVINGPGYYSPYIDIEAAQRRRNLVLARMEELGYITPEEATEAKAQPVKVIELKPIETKAPYFVDYILQNYLIPKFGAHQVSAGGLRVYTTLDLDMQVAAENALRSVLPTGTPDENKLHQPQGAIISLDPSNGQIRAMVGGRGEDHFNRATQALRQPGSAIKPIIYATAFENGLITPATIVMDEPIEIQLLNGDIYTPRNSNNVFSGEVTIRRAIEGSINVVAVKTLLNLNGGIISAINTGEKMGLSTLVKSGTINDVTPAFALGGLSKGVSPLELAAAYGVFANKGLYVEPIGIIRVEAVDGTILDEPKPVKKVALSEETAYLISDILRGVIESPYGTGQAARSIGRPAAGKTGTSQENTNAWFAGYTPQLVSVVWIGNDQQSKSLDFGSRRAVDMWTQYMVNALKDAPVSWFQPPKNIVTGIPIDIKTGLRVPDGCPIPADEIKLEIFIKGTVPTAISPRCSELQSPIGTL
jgi:penicillin-binding protein 1A